MGQVSFFPEHRAKKIDVEELQRLRNMQHLIIGARNELLNETKNLSEYWKAARKNEFHKTIRKEVKLVQ